MVAGGLMQLVAYGAISSPPASVPRRLSCACCSSHAKQQWGTEELVSAICEKHFDCLKRAASRSVRRTELDQGRLCKEAAKGGREMLALVHTKMRMAWDARAALAALYCCGDDGACFVYAAEKGAPLDDRVFYAIAKQHTQTCAHRDVVRAAFGRLRKQQQNDLVCPTDAYLSAARFGNTTFLSYALPFLRLPSDDQCLAFVEQLLLAAAQSYRSDCLQKVHKLLSTAAVPLTREGVFRICVAAAGMRSLSALRYAHEVLFVPFLASASTSTSGENEKEDPSTLLCDTAASRGSLACLMYARERGYPLSMRIAEHAMRGGDLECLKYVRETCGAEWTPETVMTSYSVGALVNRKTVRYALERGALVAPVFVAVEQGRSYLCSESFRCQELVLISSMTCCGKGAGAGRGLLEDRARAALSFFLRFGRLPQTVPFDVRTRALRRLRAITAIVRAVSRWRRNALQRAVRRIEDAWLAYRFAPVEGRKGFDAAHASWCAITS